MADIVNFRLEEAELLFRQLRELPQISEEKYMEGRDTITELRLTMYSFPKHKEEIRSKIREYEQILARHLPEQKQVNPHSRGLELLNGAMQQLRETEEIGLDTINRLKQQEEVLVRVKGNMKHVNAEADNASSILTRMSRWWRS